jgi:hypothetical protein
LPLPSKQTTHGVDVPKLCVQTIDETAVTVQVYGELLLPLPGLQDVVRRPPTVS